MKLKLREQRRFGQALKQKVCSLLVIAGLLLSPYGPALSYAANSAVLNVDVNVQGIAMITDVAATGGTSSGTINLSWTEPDRKGTTAPYSYIVHASTTGEISNINDFTNAPPLSTFSSTPIPTPGAGGGNVGVTITGLTPGVNYCFAIREEDSSTPPLIGMWLRSIPQNWNVNNCAIATTSNSIATPSGLTAQAGLDEALIRWTALSSTQTGASNLAYYELYRSTNSLGSFVSITTTTGVSYTDYPLTPFTTYYYEIAAVSQSASESSLSPAVSTVPYTLPPLEPLGIQTQILGSSITITWDATTQFADGTTFISTANPTTTELEGYQIFRSTESCTFNPVLLTTVPYTTTSLSDDMQGNLYYYQIKSYNSFGVSTATAYISYSGEQSYFLDDCISGVTLTKEQSAMLNSANNSYKGDIQIARSFLPQDTGEGILRTVQFTPMLNGKNPIPNFYFSSPVTITIAYLTSGGTPIPAVSYTPNYNQQDLGIYWDNGAQFNKLYGNIDLQNNTVSVQTPNLGTFQIRSLYRTTSAPVFDISNVSSRIITPTAGNLNSVLIFTYDPGPNNVAPTGQIFDLRGAHIANMQSGPGGNQLQWNGHASNGSVVESGVYIYQIKGGGKIFNGTVVVAR